MPAIPMSSTQIIEDLTDRITSGEYPPGSRLPSYGELAAMYSVSTATIYRVLYVLQDRKLVVGQSGRGTFVAGELPPEHPEPGASKQRADWRTDPFRPPPE